MRYYKKEVVISIFEISGSAAPPTNPEDKPTQPDRVDIRDPRIRVVAMFTSSLEAKLTPNLQAPTDGDEQTGIAA